MMMMIRRQSFKIVLLTFQNKAHLQKTTNFQYIVKQNKTKQKKSVTNLIHTFFHHSASYTSDLKRFWLLQSVKSNSEYCWKGLVFIDQTVWHKESSYCLLIVNKQQGSGWWCQYRTWHRSVVKVKQHSNVWLFWINKENVPNTNSLKVWTICWFVK